MPKPSKSRRTKKARVDPVAKLGKAIGVPAEQMANDNFERVDVVNHTDADHRAMVRALGAQMLNPDARTTVRRMPKVVELKRRGVIDQRELAACLWYLAEHESECQRIRIADLTADGGRSSDRAYGHWPAKRILRPGKTELEEAREAINPFLVALFERVVLHGRPLGRLTRSFRLAIAQLIERIEGRVQL